jgi:hypothetical protein
MASPLILQLLPGRYAVCRFGPDAPIPEAVLQEPFYSIMRTQDELSITIPEERVDPGWQTEEGWRVLKVLGPLDFAMIGVLASIAGPLAEAGVSIFVSSTFDTDYILVKESNLDRAVETLKVSGFEIQVEGGPVGKERH